MVKRGPWPVQLHDGGDGERRDAWAAPVDRAGQTGEVKAHALAAGREVDLAANAVDPLPPPKGVGVQAPRDTKARDEPVGLPRLLVARPGGLVSGAAGRHLRPHLLAGLKDNADGVGRWALPARRCTAPARVAERLRSRERASALHVACG